MSVPRGNPEVTFRGREDRFCPIADMDTVPTHDGFSPVKAIESEGGRGVTAKFATANLYCVEPVATHKSRNR